MGMESFNEHGERALDAPYCNREQEGCSSFSAHLLESERPRSYSASVAEKMKSS
jgi:hypothetical protein